jgi:hypothetical protein
MRLWVLRLATFACTLLAIWTVAFPALAAPAPYCDDRGASAMAPPPVLQPVDEAVLRARVVLVCPLDELVFSSTIAPAHRPPTPSLSSTEPAVTTAMPSVVASLGEDLPPTVVYGQPLSGVRSRVDRPPRS